MKAVTLDIAAPKEPPTEFLLFSAGKADTVKGTFIYNEAARKSIFAKMKKDGRKFLNFDYGHGQLGAIQTADTAASAGKFVPEDRDGDLWATQVEWTPRAFRGLSDGEYFHFSPAITVDPKTGVIKSLINVALTNLPATRNQEALLSEADTPKPEDCKLDTDIATLLGAVGVQSVNEVASKYADVKASETKLLSVVAETQAELEAAKAELSQLKTDAENSERDALIAELSSPEVAKLSGGLIDWAKSQSLEALKAFAEAAPSLAPDTNKIEAPKSEAKKTLSAQSVEIDDNTAKALKLLGITPEEFLGTEKEAS